MANQDPKCCPKIGGQAVIEGVMMKGKTLYSVSLRKPDGNIHTKLFDDSKTFDQLSVKKIPIVRGVVSFVESLVIGMKTLTYSSDMVLDQIEEEEPPKTAIGRWINDHAKEFANTLSIVLGVILAVGIFILIPSLLSGLLRSWIPINIVVNLIEGLIRVGIFILYLFIVSRMQDVARVFEYHGAEHKTINTFEAGEPLTVENVKRHSRQNRRCGTSFLFIVMLVSILVFAFIDISSPWLRVLLRILLIPVVAGLSYEVLMFSSKHDVKLVNWLVAPGLALQLLTTREPDDSEIEVAIASTLAVLDAENLLPEEDAELWESMLPNLEYVNDL